MDETLNELLALASKYRENKHRLNREDSETAREKLQTLFLDAGYINEACKQIAALPENCCYAFLDAWKESDDVYREQLIGALLEEPAMMRKPGVYRVIKLISDFIPVDHRVALKILNGLSKRKTRDGAELPPSWIAKRFLNELITTKKLLNISLEDHEICNHEITALAVMVLSGMFENPQENNGLAYDCFKWLEQCPGRIILGKDLIAEIEKVTKKWPEDLQRQYQKLGLIKTVSYNIKEDPVLSEASVCLEDSPKLTDAPAEIFLMPAENAQCSSPAAITQPSPADPSVDLNAGLCLDWLSRYISSLEKENASLTNKLRLLETDLSLVRKQNSEQEKQLVYMQELQNQKEQTVQKQSERIAALENEKQGLEDTLLQEKTSREKEVENLKNRIEMERNYVQEEFKNILLDRLLLHYSGYREAKGKPPSEQLANYLNHLLHKVFRELNNLGIELDGDI